MSEALAAIACCAPLGAPVLCDEEAAGTAELSRRSATRRA